MALVQDELGNWYDDGSDTGNSADDTGMVNLEGGDLGNSPPNLEGGDLGQTEAQAQDDFYRSIGIDPTTMKDTAPMAQKEIDAIISGDVYKANPDLVKTLANYFKKTDAKGNSVYDWDKIGLVGGLLAKATGLTDVKTPGYKGTVKNFTAVNAPINYNDPNRRPGGAGLDYFTPTQYVTGDAAGAQAAANQQAQGILANYRPAAPVAPKWNAANAVATPWAPKPAAPVQAAPVQAAQGGIMAAKGRYLRGETDGMADKINTSIDDKQPAKLSHGEFVVPADVVSHLGNGNSDAGAKKLYQMMDKIRIARTGTKKQGRQINPDKYMPGGSVGYSEGGITDGVQRFVTGGPAAGTSTAGNLSEWAGDAITTNIGQGIAAANRGYQGYTGNLTAGPSDLQQQQFAGASNIAQTGLAPTQYTKGTFDTAAANKYMNPYLSAALDPVLAEQRRQSQINLQPNMAKLTQAGGFGGGRQAIMESEANRNLQTQQNQTLTQGYADAYNKAMQQYNADMNRGLSTEQAQQAANEASANFGLKSLDALGQAGKTQRDIEAEGIAADRKQFEEQRDWDMKMAQYKQGLFSGMPVATQTNTQNTNPLTDWLQTGNTISELMNRFNK
jgi:hypothetical protein